MPVIEYAVHNCTLQSQVQNTSFLSIRGHPCGNKRHVPMFQKVQRSMSIHRKAVPSWYFRKFRCSRFCESRVCRYVFSEVNPRRGASGLCGLRLWTWSLYHHQRVAVNGHICSQVVDIVVMDLVQKTAMCAVLRDQGLEVQSIRFTSSVAAFAVPASVEVISFPIWNPMAFQSIVLGFSVYVPPFPSRSSRDSPRKGGWQPQLPFLLVPCFRGCDVPFPTQFFPKSDP